MADTVKQFIDIMLVHVISSYEKDRGRISRWRHRKTPTQVHLSPELYSRLLREESIPGTPDQINLEGVIVKSQIIPGIDSDFTLNVHGHCLEPYPSSQYGLKPQ